VTAVAAVVLRLLRGPKVRPAAPMAAIGFTGDWTPGPQPRGGPPRPRLAPLRATEGSEGGELAARPKPVLEPKTPVGEFLRFILTTYPHLFEESVQGQIRLLCDAQEQQSQDLAQVTGADLVLYQRIREVRQGEERKALEDILYFSVLQAFARLGITTIGPQQLRDTATFVQGNADRLVSMVHSAEEKEVVMAHMKKMLGPMMSYDAMFSNATIKLMKLQTFEMFASSLLFGYFLRHTYKRFSLARSAGLLPPDLTQSVALLEAIYEKSGSETGDLDSASPIDKPLPKPQMSLKTYLEGMDRPQQADQRRFATLESTQMVQDYLKALFGDVKVLMRQIQEVVNEPTPVTTPEEYTERMLKAVELNKIDMVEITVTGLRRMVLEAVAFGTFLKDAESFVEVTADRPVLTMVSKKGDK
jgi:hypothetical protein